MRVYDPNVVEADNWRDGHFDDIGPFEEWIRAWAEGVDLWDRMYGDAGHISRILLERDGGAAFHAVQQVLQSALGKKDDS